MVVTLSGVVGGRSLPFVFTRVALSNVQVKNWTSLVSVLTCFLRLYMSFDTFLCRLSLDLMLFFVGLTYIAVL